MSSAPGARSARRRCSTRSASISRTRCRSSARAAHAGEIAVYPLNGNVHAQGILRLTRAPYGPSAWQRARARAIWRACLSISATSACSTIEFFVRRGRLIANEMAPRVHNSGHWTIEGAVTSQFENHLRAILGLPLGSTRPLGHAAHDQSHRPHAAARANCSPAPGCTCTTMQSRRVRAANSDIAR